MLFFTSDTHFGHTNIIKYCHRPFSTVEAMDEAIIANWNATVGNDDTIYHLGDVMFMRDMINSDELLSRLQGHKVLCVGNHDRRNERKILSRHFEMVDMSQMYKIQTIDELGRSISIRMMHAPYACKPNRKQTEINLCGHVHTDFIAKNGLINVGVDMHKFRPISLAEVLRLNAELIHTDDQLIHNLSLEK